MLLNFYALIYDRLYPGREETSVLSWFNPYENFRKLLFTKITENDLGPLQTCSYAYRKYHSGCHLAHGCRQSMDIC